MNKHNSISKVLDLLADTLLEIDVNNESAKWVYNDEDAMNVLLIYNHVVGNILNHDSVNKKLHEKEAIARAQYFGEEIGEIFKNATGIDPTQFYKDKQ